MSEDKSIGIAAIEELAQKADAISNTMTFHFYGRRWYALLQEQHR
jgi:hypothetical protein